MIELALFSKWVRSGGYLVNLGKFWLAVLAVISSFSLSFLSFFFFACVWFGVGEEGVCTFKTSSCVPAPREHVEKRVGRGAGAHGDVLNVYTGGRVGIHLRVFQCVAHQTHTTTTNNTTPENSHCFYGSSLEPNASK